jgi:hypothetical protein
MKRTLAPLRQITAVLAAAAALTVAGAALGVSVAPAAKAAKAPCTKQALEAGLRRSGMEGHVVGKSWGCAGHFAYAAVIVHNIEVTVLFRAHGKSWRTTSRQKYCNKHKVPASIYKPACETS